MYLDILRIIAIILVVYNHTFGLLFSSDIEDAMRWWLMFQNQVVKMAVPLFFMITGALLLHKEEKLSDLLKKRVLRMMVVIGVIAVAQYVFFCYWKGEIFHIQHVYIMIYQELGECNEFYANWFLYAYVGILLMLPVLRIVAKHLTRDIFLYLIVLQFFLCCVWPVMGLLMGEYVEFSAFNYWLPFHPETGDLPYSAGYCAFYVLMGYYLEHKVSMEEWERNKGKYFLVAMACLFGGMLSMWLASTMAGEGFSFQKSVYMTAFLPVPCAVAYMTVKSMCLKFESGQPARIVIAQLGGAVFTVMLIENMFRISWDSIYDQLESSVGLWGASWIYAILIFVASVAVGVLLKHVPGFKHIL